MIICPYCDHENINGTDLCEGCGQPIGRLSLPTPATGVERSLLKDCVSMLSLYPPCTTPFDTPVKEVLQLLNQHTIGCVLVVKEGCLVGIFSERDVIKRLGAKVKELEDRPISEFMTPDPTTLTPKTKVAYAVRKMDLNNYRHIPIISDTDSQVLGIISVKEILRYLTEKMAAE